jgi:DNA-binding Lrp family transcriptional regulator
MSTENADAAWIAKRLGLSEEVVRRLQRRGVLSRFDLSDAEIRRRLYDANVRGGPSRTT